MSLAPLSAGFQSCPLLPTSKLGLSHADSRVDGFVYILGPCGSLSRPLLGGWEFLLLLPQPPQVFSVSGLRLHFPVLEAWVAWSDAGSTSHHLAVSPLLPAAHLHPSYWSGGMFLLQLLGCQTSIQFDFLSVLIIFLFLNLLLSLFWLSEGAQCIYLCLHVGQK